MKLAILIPTLHERQELRERVLENLYRQIWNRPSDEHEIDVLINVDNRGDNTTGLKRNDLIQRALFKGADYFAFMDDDDLPGDTYVKRGIEVMESGMDCGELWGQIYWSGKPGMPFHHYHGCTHAWQDDKQYHRPPNHLNFMKLDLVKDFKFEDKTFGEDMCWAMEIHKAGTFKTMYPIPEIIYHYFCGEPKHAL